MLREKIFSVFSRKKYSVRKIAEQTNIPKSTVSYHKQGIDKRIETSGTDYWETQSGNEFIIRLVVAVIFIFCIKSGNGAGRVEEFFVLLKLSDYLPASQTTILRIIKRIEELILEYRNAVEEKIYYRVKEIELILGVDETWFDRMVLVCQELSSGYIFVETEARQRDATTWNMHIKKIFKLLPHAVIKYFVSDRAKALVNLATVIHKVTSVADCFHFKYCINKLLCIALAGKLRRAKIDFTSASNSKNVEQIIPATEKYSQIQYYTDLYAETMSNISHSIHPFFQGNKTNTSDRAKGEINIQLENIQRIIDENQISDKYNLFSKAQQQVPDVVEVIYQWHKIKDERIAQINIPDTFSQWFEEYLLPKTYWETVMKRTNHKPTLNNCKQELQQIQQDNISKTLIADTPQLVMDSLKKQANEICRKFQRASSQVEGRNGYLSAINHNQRGFDNQRLEVLTVVHNFDIRGLDKKTPAERLFENHMKFDSLFEYIIDSFDELPRKRIRKATG